MELKRIRTQKGLTQQAVADSILCSPSVYARYERGEREPSIEMLLKLSALFGVSTDELLGNPEKTLLSLSESEMELVIASRNADGRAREDALLILRAHPKARK